MLRAGLPELVHEENEGDLSGGVLHCMFCRYLELKIGPHRKYVDSRPGLKRQIVQRVLLTR